MKGPAFTVGFRGDFFFMYYLFTFNCGVFEERKEIWGNLSLMGNIFREIRREPGF